MRHIYIFILLVLLTKNVSSQLISLNPATFGPDEAVTITFNANEGNKELVGASKVYMHHGVVTDKVDGTAWSYVKGNWGKDDGVGLMTKVPGESDKWSITLNPNIRAYFGVPAGQNIFRISCVFRNEEGTVKGTLPQGNYGWGTVTSNQDIYINLNNKNYLTFIEPIGSDGFISPGSALKIRGEASSNVTSMTLSIDEGNGYEVKQQTNGGKTIAFDYVPSTSTNIGIKITANINGESLMIEKTYNITVRKDTEIAPLPPSLKQGVNYNINDATKLTLVLLAPEKDFVYAVGDFSNWQVNENYQMKKTPDGKYFWLELQNLIPQQSYVYQYWIDGKLKLADPYTEQVADPWNDQWIEPETFPDLPTYDKQEFGLASVFKTGQTSYNWAATEESWQRPDVNHLVIYELHLRDFIASHSFNTLIDTIQYLKRLGINAIELMPVNEFEGNDSWGYNPSFYFAVDKYYGTKDALKRFVEVAHQNGMAVIIDMVLNHSFGQSPMVQMYFDGGKPASNNPWFNREYVGEFQWGYDFNHESPFTKTFIDDVNKFWIEEFHVDGYRFDFTKGFTNFAPGGNINGFDQSRINILKRMADVIWSVDPKSYVILEHWSPEQEETQLANLGMKMWRNKTQDFIQPTIGNPTSGSFSGSDATTHVSLYGSHDERRLAEHCLSEGRSVGSYNIKDSLVMFERVKMAYAFNFLQPGPKMIWQFDELAYDIDINFNGRVGRKPYVWGAGSLNYYKSSLRQNVYKTLQGILDIRNKIGPATLKGAQKSHQNTGDVRRLTFNTNGIDLVLVGNFGLTAKSIDPKFSQTGTWYNYFSGDSIIVTNVNTPIALKVGEWQVFTSKRLGSGLPDVVSIYQNPVTINPNPFKGSQKIKIRFDASLASNGDSDGLLDADKVYMHSGVILRSASNNQLTNIVGNLVDDNVGVMTKVGDQLWEIEITPNEYYNIASGAEILQLGMWFRNGDNTKKGFGFRNGIIYFDVLSDRPLITINPQSFKSDTEITITFNAGLGNRELKTANKIYMHSGIVTVNTQNPQSQQWSKVVGNWGKDDGIGLMTKVPNEQDLWQIKLTPNTYYGLTSSEFPYWISAVFRSADGSSKGTGTPGNYDFGLIASNQDYYLKNLTTVDVDDLDTQQIYLFPNPAHSFIQFKGVDGPYTLKLTTLDGKEVFRGQFEASDKIDVTDLSKGVYIYTLHQRQKSKSGSLVVQH